MDAARLSHHRRLAGRESGFYYLQSRYYDPSIGRFINADAAEFSSIAALSLAESNLFVYCRNNPVSYGDDDGELAHVVGAAIVGAALSAGAEALSQALVGDGFDVEAIIVEAIGGAVFGAIAASTGSTGAADIISAGVKSVTSSCIAGDDLKTTMLEATKEMAVAGMTVGLSSGTTKLIRSTAPKGGALSKMFYEGKHINFKSPQTKFTNSVSSSLGDAVDSTVRNTISGWQRKSQNTSDGVKGVDWWMKYYA